MLKRYFVIFLFLSISYFSCSDDVNQESQDIRTRQDVFLDTGLICRSKTDCPIGKDCIGGKCVDMVDDGGIDTGFDIAIVDIGNGGKNCTKNEECPQNYRCNLSNNMCEEIIEPKICLTENQLDFGYVQYGQSKEKCTVLTNCGNADLKISGVDFGSGTSSAYQFKLGQEKRKTLKPGSSDYLEICVIVKPNSEEAPQGTVEVYSDAEPAKLVIPLKSQYKGSSDFVFVDDKNKKVWPDGNTSTFRVDFGLVGPGNKKSLKFKIMNATDGDKPLLIKTLDKFATQFSGRFFDINDDSKDITLPAIIGPSQVIGLELVYAPTQRSPKDQGNLLIETNDPDIDNNGVADNGKLMIDCNGVAEFPPDISVDPLLIDFGDVQKGVKNPPKKKILIVNTADPVAGQTLKITAEIGNSTETSFTFNPTSHDIPPGEGREIEVSFAPTALDVRTNTIKISSNAPDNANPGKYKSFEVSVKGRGIDPQMNIEPTGGVLDFGEVEINKFAQKTVTITNLTGAGLGVLTVYEPELATQNSPFSFTSDKQFVNGEIKLNPGEKITLTVRYAPTRTGSNSNVLKIKSNDEDLLQKDISLFGICVDYNGDPIAVAKIIGATDPKKGYFEPNTTVTIDGSESQDPDLNQNMRKIEEYLWELIEKPAGSNATLGSTNQVTTTIRPDKIGIYKIGLKVRDNENIWSPQDVVQVIGINKESLLIATKRSVGLKYYKSILYNNQCVHCSYDGLGIFCSTTDKNDLRWEVNRIIIEQSPETSLVGYYCDALVDNSPKHNCNWGRLGEVLFGYDDCDYRALPYPNPLYLLYNTAPTDEYENIYIVQLEYMDDISDNSSGARSSLSVTTEFYINNSLVKTIDTTLANKGQKKDIARIKRQFGKYEIIVLP
ncbi:MAG: choice-of-anchor D domain-containing protein [Deltaproteobacteria bacterium]|nr:choice-of-anchor D domain-containing protein [Deltaproteobacteria bacterium]